MNAGTDQGKVAAIMFTDMVGTARSRNAMTTWRVLSRKGQIVFRTKQVLTLYIRHCCL